MIKLLNILSEIKVEKNPAIQIVLDYIKRGSIGDLDLRSTPIQSLPPGLKVRGNLNLRNTPIKSLPDDLKVRGNLNLRNTPIQSLPDDLEVEYYLDLRNTPISKKYTREEIREMVPGVKGSIFLV